MKKILFIAHDDLGGGSGRALYEHIQLLVESQEFIPVVITLKKNNLYYALRKLGVDVYYTKYDFTAVWNTIKFFFYIKRLYYRFIFNALAYRSLNKKNVFSNISLIVSNSCVVGLGAYLYKKLSIPHIWFLREFGDDLVPLVKNIASYIDSNSTKIVAVSDAVKNRWIEKGVSVSKIDTLYDGVLLPPKKLSERVSCDQIRLCMCGRISKFKGQIYAIKAIQSLPEKIRSQIRLDVYGKGYESFFLKRYVKKNNLESNVVFRGFDNNLEQTLYDYDIGLNLTAQEGFGRTTVEYMLHCLYVIACNSGASPEVIEYGTLGSLVEYGSIEQVAKELLSYVNNQEEKKKIAALGKLKAEERFDSKKNVYQFLRLYKETID